MGDPRPASGIPEDRSMGAAILGQITEWTASAAPPQRQRDLLMKFLLLIGGSYEAWARLGPDDWSENEEPHGALIAQLKQAGEFIECHELNVTPAGARIVRTANGVTSTIDGPLHDSGDFASGYYVLECADIDRASEIAAQLYESRFAPIEVRQIGA